MRDRLIIKAEARRLVQQGHVSPILATAVVLAVCFVLDRLVDLAEGGSLFATFQYDWAYLQAVSSGDLDSIQAVLDLAPQATVTSLALTIAVSLFTAVLSGGYCLFCLDILHRREAALSTLMDGLGSAGRLIWCNILIAVKIALWTMLGMVPVLVFYAHGDRSGVRSGRSPGNYRRLPLPLRHLQCPHGPGPLRQPGHRPELRADPGH